MLIWVLFACDLILMAGMFMTKPSHKQQDLFHKLYDNSKSFRLYLGLNLKYNQHQRGEFLLLKNVLFVKL